MKPCFVRMGAAPCADRNRLVSPGARAASGNSRLHRPGRSRGSGTLGHAPRGNGGSSEAPSVPRPSRNRAWRSGVGHRRHSLHRSVPCARQAGHDPYPSARSAAERALSAASAAQHPGVHWGRRIQKSATAPRQALSRAGGDRSWKLEGNRPQSHSESGLLTSQF